ncbi:carbamoyl-phosphate synthase (glutamine-hydrolyzing) large subunit [Pseudalkalibacillus caeni]|uniref:Carbamoyl phosphate synthase large chain n=1 Tax=Exobacillus caeni TaxID=2574798 RepID=A0A5R9F5D8_9BACL|nr:carbamoyl-phosphate synthase (glutamine-hydrolyzing) large subunit [Pseudalkalibacillus caeni]TLS36858.1 carbamoyl-phosphate synthase (glutamine-hydrolyzing) large subunit [Pseudalkalibacillus caeni]
MPLRKKIHKVLVIGSGPIVIGQAAEFDYAGTQACLALKEEGIEVVLVNNNPATIMTDQSIADKVYMEPLSVEVIEKIISIERPDGVIGTLGGQTGLNLTVKLKEQGILDKYNVKLLGTSVDSIKKGEDRELFRSQMIAINEPIPESSIIVSVAEGLKFAEKIGFPVIVRPAYTLGGEGGGFAYGEEELETILKKGLQLSPIHQVLVEKSIKGWKEVEYEVIRDENDTCIIVCNMENMDPVGVHTGDSIVVAPSQTLTDREYQMLRNASLKVIRSLEIIGGCNIQFALDPESQQYYIIEVNPRVSRSSALASKATGYPIARIAAKCAIGYHLDEIKNPITGNTFASFEPALDYIVVKLPRFPFDKFTEADRSLGTQMKATGEVMAIDRSFEGALNKAIRSLEMNVSGLSLPFFKKADSKTLNANLEEPTDIRLFALAEALRRGMETEELHNKTQVDIWFLEKIKGLIELEQKLLSIEWEHVPEELLKQAKKKNISDAYIAKLYSVNEKDIRNRRKQLGLIPGYKQVDTCAAEFEAITPYFYSTWSGADEVTVPFSKKVLVIGSGPIRIGQGVEFDFCSVQAALALQKKGYEAIVINNNPETVSTDYSIADRLYFEPLTSEDILHVVEKEQVEAVMIQFGGQTAINVAEALKEEGVKILGTSIESIDRVEDRDSFYGLLKELEIPHIEGETIETPGQLQAAAKKLGYPVLVRPSYVIGGQSMFIFYNEKELKGYMKHLQDEENRRIWPLLIDKYLPGLECEVDVISDGEDIVIPGIMEHTEKAGVHSGDSISIFPPVSLSKVMKEMIVAYSSRIAKEIGVIGMMNIQFVISKGIVYVLEVNPRSSRTVPIMSKVTGVPMVDWAVFCQVGDSLDSLSTNFGLLKEPGYYAVKAPVFSNGKLKDVDHVLGPEMKSTGETLGIGATPEEALEKALFPNKPNPFTMNAGQFILLSITDREKEASITIARELSENGHKLMATGKTAEFLLEQGISVENVGRNIKAVETYFKEEHISTVINIPNQGRIKEKFGFELRALASRFSIPCFTSLDTVNAILQIPADMPLSVKAINEMNESIKLSI